MSELTSEAITGLSTSGTLELDLDAILGERKAFGLIAGHCAAGQAECIKKVRDRKLFKSRCGSWDEFCPKYLRLSRAHANRLIQAWEEFGPPYFEMAEFTPITPEEFRAIGHEVGDTMVNVESEAIALLPENAEQLISAVEYLRSKSPAEIPQTRSSHDPLARLERRCDELIAEFQNLDSQAVNPSLLSSVIEKTLTALARINHSL